MPLDVSSSVASRRPDPADLQLSSSMAAEVWLISIENACGGLHPLASLLRMDLYGRASGGRRHVQRGSGESRVRLDAELLLRLDRRRRTKRAPGHLLPTVGRLLPGKSPAGTPSALQPGASGRSLAIWRDPSSRRSYSPGWFGRGSAAICPDQSVSFAPDLRNSVLVLDMGQARHGAVWRAWVGAAAPRVPVLGPARRNLALARLSLSLESLLTAGVSVVEAWPLAAAASGSPALQRTVGVWAPSWKAGGDAASCRASPS